MKNLKRIVVCALFACMMSMNSHAGAGSIAAAKEKPFYAALLPMKKTPIKLNVDMTFNMIVKGVKCSVHVTGYVVMDFAVGSGFQTIVDQQLTYHFNCKGEGGAMPNVRQAYFDGEQYTSFFFEESGDEELDDLARSSEFADALLSEMNAGLMAYFNWK
jgi:DnaJ-class molecular chaperone